MSADLTTRFQTAARRGDSALVSALLANSDLDVNEPNSRDGGFNALCYAAYEGRLEVVLLLLSDPRIVVDARSADKKTALVWAAYKDHLAVLDALLLDKRADPNARSNSGSTAFAYACAKGFLGIAERLLRDSRVDPSITGLDRERDKLTPFCFACAEGQTAIVKLLLKSSTVMVDFNARGSLSGRTGLVLACLNNRVETVKVMLKCRQKLDLDIPDKKGMLARDAGNEETQRLFRETLEKLESSNPATLPSNGRPASSEPSPHNAPTSRIPPLSRTNAPDSPRSPADKIYPPPLPPQH